MSDIHKVRFLSRRGLKELDILLSRYVNNYYDQADDDEKEAYRELLLKEDQDILDFILVEKQLENPLLKQLQLKLRAGA